MANRWLQDEEQRKRDALAETGMAADEYEPYVPDLVDPAPEEPAVPEPEVSVPPDLVDAPPVAAQADDGIGASLAEMAKRVLTAKRTAKSDRVSSDIYHTFAGSPIPERKAAAGVDGLTPWKLELLKAQIAKTKANTKGGAGGPKLLAAAYQALNPNSPIPPELINQMEDDTVKPLFAATTAVGNLGVRRENTTNSNADRDRKFSENVRQFGLNYAMKERGADQRDRGLDISQTGQDLVGERYDNTTLQKLQTTSTAFAPMVQTLKAIDKIEPGIYNENLPPGEQAGLDNWARLLRALPKSAGTGFMKPQEVALKTALQRLQGLMLKDQSGATVTDSEREQFKQMFGDALLAGPQAAKIALNIFRREIGAKLAAAQVGYEDVIPAHFDRYVKRGGPSYQDPIFSDLMADREDPTAGLMPPVPGGMQEVEEVSKEDAAAALGLEAAGALAGDAPVQIRVPPKPAPKAPAPAVKMGAPTMAPSPAAPKAPAPGSKIRRKDGSVWQVEADGSATMIKPPGN